MSYLPTLDNIYMFDMSNLPTLYSIYMFGMLILYKHVYIYTRIYNFKSYKKDIYPTYLNCYHTCLHTNSRSVLRRVYISYNNNITVEIKLRLYCNCPVMLIWAKLYRNGFLALSKAQIYWLLLVLHKEY